MLPTNYNKCEQRTRSMVRRLAATLQLLTTYESIIAEHETRGFIERVDNPQPTDNAHYIPHHPVRKDSATTPIGICYDCSFHSSPDNPSLNDCLLVGPPLLNNIVLFCCGSAPTLMACQQTLKRHFSMLVWTTAIETQPDFSGYLTPRIPKANSKSTASRLFCLALPAPRSC